MQASNQTMPESLAAEAAVLGSMMIDVEALAEVAENLKSEDFYRVEHQIIFDTLVRLYNKNDGQAVDAVLLRQELVDNDQMKNVGGVEYIAKILESVPSSANAMYYSKIVKEKACSRKMIQAVGNLSKTVENSIAGLADKRAAFEQAAMDAAFETETSRTVHVKDEAVEVCNKLLDRGKKDVKPEGLLTGFYELDGLIRSISPANLVILAGRTSMGKSSLMLDMTLNVASDDYGVAIFSLEMSPHALIERLIANQARQSLHRLKQGDLSASEWQEIIKATGELSEKNIIIADVPTLTPAALTTQVLRLRTKNKIDIVFVDYIQLMTIGRRIESRQQEVTAISRGLKAIAKKTNLPIVALSQLSRERDKRSDHRPKLSDLRESGAIEQDADLVLLLHRDDYYRKQEKQDSEEDGKAVCIVAKNRQGPTGDAEMVWLPKYFSFANPSKDKSLYEV